MATIKQIKANRKNAIKGGVKTKEGKAISSQNATKYGFFSKITTKFDKLNNEDFCKSIYNCFMPANEYENQMVEILLSNLLTFRRICLVEKEYLETKIHPDIEMDFSICLKKGYEPEIKLDLIDELNKFQKYKTSIQNNLIKIEHELERLMANRNSEYKYIQILQVTINIDFIKNTISSMIHNYKLYIFGSRAKNRAKKYSDIDLAIDSQELTPQRKILRTLQKIRSNPNKPIGLLGSQIPNITHNKKANNIKSLAFYGAGDDSAERND